LLAGVIDLQSNNLQRQKKNFEVENVKILAQGVAKQIL